MLSTILFTATLYVSKAYAVTILHYPTDDCTGNQLLRCPDFPEGLDVCCQVPMGPASTAMSVLFQGLPLPAAQGIYYKAQDSATNYCDRSCAAGSGLNLCLHCDIMMVNIVTAGANWIQTATKEKREVQADNLTCTPVHPSIYTVGDRHFNIGSEAGVPQEDTDAFLAMWNSGGVLSYEDIPARLLRHENTTYAPETD